MSLNVKYMSLLFLNFLIAGCVTFNNIEGAKIPEQSVICAEIIFKEITRSSFTDVVHESELDNLSRLKILQVLKSLQIDTKCYTDKIKLEVKINRKISNAYAGFLGGWSIFTVLSAGLIPSYSSFDTEIFVLQNGELKGNTSFHYSAAVWLPFVVKNIKDDAYSFANYNIDARSAVIGIEISKLIRSSVSGQEKKY